MSDVDAALEEENRRAREEAIRNKKLNNGYQLMPAGRKRRGAAGRKAESRGQGGAKANDAGRPAGRRTEPSGAAHGTMNGTATGAGNASAPAAGAGQPKAKNPFRKDSPAAGKAEKQAVPQAGQEAKDAGTPQQDGAAVKTVAMKKIGGGETAAGTEQPEAEPAKPESAKPEHAVPEPIPEPKPEPARQEAVDPEPAGTAPSAEESWDAGSEPVPAPAVVPIGDFSEDDDPFRDPADDGGSAEMDWGSFEAGSTGTELKAADTAAEPAGIEPPAPAINGPHEAEHVTSTARQTSVPVQDGTEKSNAAPARSTTATEPVPEPALKPAPAAEPAPEAAAEPAGGTAQMQQAEASGGNAAAGETREADGAGTESSGTDGAAEPAKEEPAISRIARRIREAVGTGRSAEKLEVPGLGFTSNADGYYDDVEPAEGEDDDRFILGIALRAAGALIAMFAVTNFLIYYL